MSARTPLIAGNWKMHKTGTEAAAAAVRLQQLLAEAAGVEVMIAPPFTAIYPVAQVIDRRIIAIGAQNAYWEHQGAYTGEISMLMLRDAGCRYVIIGHSERRQLFGERDAAVNRKIGAAIGAGLVPILCIGETEAQRDAGETLSVLDKQLRSGLKGVSFSDPLGLVVAYEPVWAIGTGKTAGREQAQEAHRFIRSLLKTLYGEPLAAGVRILYGGSVKPDNIRALMQMPDVDGALVGGASLDPDTFSRLVLYNP